MPALVGRPGRQQLIQLPCPAWCIIDHVALHERAVEDISHMSSMFGAQVESMADPGTTHIQLFARINSDPAHEDPRMRAAHVLVGDGSPVDAFLTPDATDEAADELIAFAMEMKELANRARLANQGIAV